MPLLNCSVLMCHFPWVCELSAPLLWRTIRIWYFWIPIPRCGELITAIVCQYFINQSALLQQLIVTETQERNGPMVTLTVNNILMVCADCNITTVAGGVLAIIMSSMSDVASVLYNYNWNNLYHSLLPIQISFRYWNCV